MTDKDTSTETSADAGTEKGAEAGVLSSELQGFQWGDVVVGDWIWGVGARHAYPVIRVNRHAVTVGIHRVPGGWMTTEAVPWEDIRGVIPAVPAMSSGVISSGVVPALTEAASRVRRGFLSYEQREALAAVMLITGSSWLPTPVVASLLHAVTALTRTRRHEQLNDSTTTSPRDVEPDEDGA